MHWECGSSEKSGIGDEGSHPEEESTVLAQRTMSLWVVAIADNIRNPVAGMGAALEVLRHQIALKDQSLPTGNPHNPEIMRHAIEKIQHRLASLNEYVTELVDFAKPPILHKEGAELDGVIIELERELRGHYPFSIQVTTRIDASVMKKIFVDRSRLKASLKALLVNGIDAACSLTSLAQVQVIPRVHLEVTSTAEADGRERLVFAVEDNGMGFTPESSQKAFDAFFSTKEAGTGLGLYLVRKYIRAHDGGVFIEPPQRLNGARVGFWIPSVPCDHRAEKSNPSGARL